MKNIRWGLLLAAATIAALPAPGSAQEHGAARQGERGDLDRPVGAGRGQGRGNDQNGGWRQRGPGPEAPGRAAPPGGQMAPPAAPAPGPRFEADRQARAAEYARRQGQEGRGFDGNWSRGPGAGRRDGDRPAPSFQGQPGRPQRFDDNRGFAGRDDHGGDPRRYGDRGRDNRGFDDRRFDDRRFDNRGAWQRNWRNDRRYDWQGWRTRNRGIFRSPRYIPPRGYSFGYRIFSPGYRLDPFFYDQGYWLADPWAYRLPPAYGPYRWVRYYNDVLLVDITRGVVVDVIRDFFW